MQLAIDWFVAFNALPQRSCTCKQACCSELWKDGWFVVLMYEVLFPTIMFGSVFSKHEILQ